MTHALLNYQITKYESSVSNTNHLSTIHSNLREKYTTTTEFYNAKIIHDIMYNENSQVVSVFKDYLILDDLTEFLKRSYTGPENHQRLPKIYKFYASYANVYPNYAALPENKYLFKNFTKKQKAFEERQKQILAKQKIKPTVEEREKAMNSIMSEERLFDQKFIEEVKKMPYLEEKKDYEKMKLSRIIDSFLQNSSVMLTNKTHQSSIRESTGSMFSRHTSQSKLIPDKTLQVLEKDPE